MDPLDQLLQDMAEPLGHDDNKDSMIIMDGEMNYHLFVPSWQQSLLGAQIMEKYPHSFHFLAGCGQFDPLHNQTFKELAKGYLVGRLLEDEEFRCRVVHHNKLAVKGEINGLLDRARQEYGDVRIWYKLRKQDSVTRATWETLWYKDITATTATTSTHDRDNELSLRLGEFLRGILTRVRAEYMAGGQRVEGSTKTLRHHDAGALVAFPNTSTSSPTAVVAESGKQLPPPTAARKRNKRARGNNAHDDPHDNDCSSSSSIGDQDQDAMIERTLAEIRAKVDQDIRELEAMGDLKVYRRQVEYGNIVMPRLGRLTAACINAGQEWTEWTQDWAKQLLPKAERKGGEEFDSHRLIEANSLDADRKVCVEYLKILNRNFAQMGSLEVANQFPRRHLVNILNCTLEMDRAKCCYFNFYKPKGRRGMHWFAQNHIDPKSTKWYKEKWAEYVKADYEGDATISKRLMWLFDEEAFGLQDEKRNRRLHELLEPQKANWVDVEGDSLE